jgi:hypothetical protein
VVGRHVLECRGAEIPPALKLAAVENHLREARIVACVETSPPPPDSHSGARGADARRDFRIASFGSGSAISARSPGVSSTYLVLDHAQGIEDVLLLELIERLDPIRSR